ncbi:hypothetical protein MUG78_16915 [Gordonia alkaliphila]|uniref:hypothetical protein n=1 Tax=Gordonia alkaliphila TaxID=1053547 RepID=UPI001FF1A337|nr:hypothetical protein [Gordonia alkaliphila]MCK0441083.1 hypothetical protein [Gordonia alkaliphila]
MDAQQATTEPLAAEILDELVEQYTPIPVPPCRICGADLEIERLSSGQPTRYVCPVANRQSKKAGINDLPALDHYMASQDWHTDDSDLRVVALVAEVRALRAAADGRRIVGGIVRETTNNPAEAPGRGKQ